MRIQEPGMLVEVRGRKYETSYFPFFRSVKDKDFDIWYFYSPSGLKRKITIYDRENLFSILEEYLSFLVEEYLLEENDALTPKAMDFKEDLKKLFELNE